MCYSKQLHIKNKKQKTRETPASPVMHLRFRGSLLSLVPDWILQSGPHGLKLTFDFTFCLFVFFVFHVLLCPLSLRLVLTPIRYSAELASQFA